MTKNKAALLKQLRLALNDLEDREHALHYVASKGIYDTSIPEARVKWEQDRVDALLYKLREEGVQAGDERAALQKLVKLEDMRLRLRALHESGHGTDYDAYRKALPAAWEAARAALASAPVAGERVCKTCGGSRVDPGGLSICRDCSAAPQASEAVRNAERYEWLRDPSNAVNVEIPNATGTGYDLPGYGEALDIAVDAAMNKSPQADKGRGGCVKSAIDIVSIPEVDKALSVFIDEDTWENAVELVQAILDASKQTDNLKEG